MEETERIIKFSTWQTLPAGCCVTYDFVSEKYYAYTPKGPIEHEFCSRWSARAAAVREWGE